MSGLSFMDGGLIVRKILFDFYFTPAVIYTERVIDFFDRRRRSLRYVHAVVFIYVCIGYNSADLMALSVRQSGKGKRPESKREWRRERQRKCCKSFCALRKRCDMSFCVFVRLLCICVCVCNGHLEIEQRRRRKAQHSSGSDGGGLYLSWMSTGTTLRHFAG